MCASTCSYVSGVCAFGFLCKWCHCHPERHGMSHKTLVIVTHCAISKMQSRSLSQPAPQHCCRPRLHSTASRVPEVCPHCSVSLHTNRVYPPRHTCHVIHSAQEKKSTQSKSLVGLQTHATKTPSTSLENKLYKVKRVSGDNG